MTTSPTPRDPFDAFSEEVHHLRVSWTLWRRLFDRAFENSESPEQAVAAGDEAYRVTGAASQLFFVYVRWHMLAGVVTIACRLCDPPATGGRANLTVQRILDDAKTQGTSRALERASRTATHLFELMQKPAGLRALRNKILAHIDLGVATRVSAIPDPNVDEINRGVRLLVEFQHIVSLARVGTPVGLGDPKLHPNQADEDPWKAEVDHLVAVLARGLER